MQLHGVHHVTAVTADVKLNKRFYTETLGLRLVKKSVNQDDVSAYHMFYADKLGSPGTDMTFFDWPQTAANTRGTDSISNTRFRVNGEAALNYWLNRLESNGIRNSGIESFDGRSLLRFEDPEEQQLTLVDDQGAPFEGEVWDGVDIPAAFALRGFYSVELTVPRLAQMEPIFTKLLGFEKVKELPGMDNPNQKMTIYAMDGGGPGKELQVLEVANARPGLLGHGGVHHVAFRLRDDEEQQAWLQQLNSVGVPNSGIVDRYYFKSLYFRISRGILFELATDGPGFATDEPLASLGEKLALPPFLEPRRREIEANLKPV
jgi:glyoxalase family protein